jgi:hypothetical protein
VGSGEGPEPTIRRTAQIRAGNSSRVPLPLWLAWCQPRISCSRGVDTWTWKLISWVCGGIAGTSGSIVYYSAHGATYRGLRALRVSRHRVALRTTLLAGSWWSRSGWRWLEGCWYH